MVVVGIRGGWGRIRTYEAITRRIYSPLPLTTRATLRMGLHLCPPAGPEMAMSMLAMGLEPMTSSLPRKCSTAELREPTDRAGDGTRTRDIQLGRLTLYQLSYSRLYYIVVGEGFEPSKAKPADLQSALVDRLSIPPKYIKI